MPSMPIKEYCVTMNVQVYVKATGEADAKASALDHFEDWEFVNFVSCERSVYEEEEDDDD